MSKKMAASLDKKIDTIFFDADDTLYTIRGTIGERYAPYFHKHGFSIAAEELNTIVWDCWSSRSITGRYENSCLLYTSPSPRDATLSRMPSSA